MSKEIVERNSRLEKVRIPIFMGTMLIAFFLLFGSGNSSADTNREVDIPVPAPTPNLVTPEAIVTQDTSQLATQTPDTIILEPSPYAAPYFDGDMQKQY